MIVDAYEYVGGMDRLAWLSGLYWPHRCQGPYVAHCNGGRMVYFEFSGECDKGVDYEWSHSREVFKGNRIGTFNTETGELTLDEKKFDGGPGVPDGWRLVRIGTPKKGEHFVDYHGNAICCTITVGSKGFAIIERTAPCVEVGKWYQLQSGGVQRVDAEISKDVWSSNTGAKLYREDFVREVKVEGAE